jgi:nitrogen-specific signal transduction histidine kinase
LDKVEITITDSGRGIPSELQEKIFKGQIEKPEGSKGFGMGLLMVEAIMQAYQCEVKLASSKAGQTTFILYLPIAN